jgi:glycosyltransferase involved in cell wall biosynthesis
MKLFYCSKAQYGGWVSFTAHLALTTGYPLYKPSKVTRGPRPFGYGVDYSLTKDISGDCLITAIDKHFYSFLPLFPTGSSLVIHDPTELTATLLPHLSRFNIITIRPLVQKLLQDRYKISSTLFLHPFHPDEYPVCEKAGAVSISRIDYDKHTGIILKANQNMEYPVALYGAVNRLYVFNQLKALGFDDHYRGTFAKTKEALREILSGAKYVVDMSLIKNDGGGSQYTFLEAIAAGCVLVLHRLWLQPVASL